MKSIIFVGSSGQFKIMKPIAELQGFKVVAVFDDKISRSPFQDVSLWKVSNLEDWVEKFRRVDLLYFSVTIGNNVGRNAQIREELSEKLIELGLKPINLIHPSVIIYNDVNLGQGLQISANVTISANVSIGDWCIINAGTVIEHDTVLGKSVECAPGTMICGNVSTGNYSWLCSGSILTPNIKLADNITVGAGAMVLKSCDKRGVRLLGIPSKIS